MAKFSASDAAMTGFGVVARRPTVLIWWIILHLIFMAATSTLMVIVAGPAMTQLTALQAQHTPADPQTQAQMFAIFGQIAPLYLVMFPIIMAFYAVLFAAMNRAVLRPWKSAFGYLRLGVDEWRQFLLFLWVGVVAFLLELAVILVGGVLVVAAAMLFKAMNKGAGLAVWAPMAVIGFFLIAYIYGAVRFSLASAMTFDTGKVSFLKSWRLTRGRFWPMFGAYALAVILSIVVSLLGLVVMIAGAMLAGGVGGLGFLFRPDMSSLAAYFTTPRLIYFALAGVVYALVWPILLTPPAAIYKVITAKPEPTPASWPSPPAPLEPTPAPDPFCAVPDAPTHP